MFNPILAAAIIVAMALTFASTQIALSIRFLKMASLKPQPQIQVVVAWDRIYIFFWDSGLVLMSRDMGDTWTHVANLNPREF